MNDPMRKESFQKTIKSEVSQTGHGLFTGERVTLRLVPAEVNSGIVFCRKDLPHKPKIAAHVSFVSKTPRCTTLADPSGAIIGMVEHLLSAVYASGIDNLLIELEGPEVPACDGSSLAFIEMIEKAGIETLDSAKKIKKLSKPVYFSEGDAHLVALPDDKFRVSYTMHYPHSTFLRSQYYSTSVDSSSFKKEIAMCRTFSLYEEIAFMLEKGLLKGGGLENGVVIKNNAVMNPEGLRFPDEMVRHKVLDLIGDLSLVGCAFNAHVIAIRSGHATNAKFAEILLKHFEDAASV